MITRARRSMTAEELSEVERLASDAREVLGCYAALLLLGVAGAGALGGRLGALVATAVGALLWTSTWLRRRGATAEDEVELVHVHAFAAAAAPGLETYVFDGGEEQAVVVRGPATRAPSRAGRFPNRYFTLVRLPRADRTLRIECHGEPLAARAVEGDARLELAARADALVVPAASLPSGWRP